MKVYKITMNDELNRCLHDTYLPATDVDNVLDKIAKQLPFTGQVSVRIEDVTAGSDGDWCIINLYQPGVSGLEAGDKVVVKTKLETLPDPQCLMVPNGLIEFEGRICTVKSTNNGTVVLNDTPSDWKLDPSWLTKL